jgi:CRP/FNR family cyclic AMP-dependent transcriptional regulator
MLTIAGKEPKSVLAQTPMFADLNETELNALSRRMLTRRFSAGELIFAEGDSCLGMYVIETGSVKIFKSSAGGREQVLAIDGPGDTIAEVPVFDGGPYPASAMAVKDTAMLFISKADFRAVCLDCPDVSLKVLRFVGRRLRTLVNIIEDLSFTTVRSRLAALLLRLARSGNPSADGVVFSLPVSNQELAAQIGTVRELVSRNLSRLQAAGIIRIEGRTVVVRSMKALELEIEAG